MYRHTLIPSSQELNRHPSPAVVAGTHQRVELGLMPTTVAATIKLITTQKSP